MPHLKYAWLQEALAELIRHTTEAGLHSVSEELNAALAKVRQADTGHAPRADAVQIATVRLVLEECQIMLAELGEFQAAEDVAHAIRLLPEDLETASIAPPTGRMNGSRH